MGAPETTRPAEDAQLAAGVLARDRRALARAITLVESTRPDHRARAGALLDALLPAANRSLRIGVSGSPGVGKSTFIEALGMHAIDQAHRVAVLAVDPTSTRSGGSILGDKTRMARLARHADAFIRPSPAGDALGGVAARTREAMLLCEAAGFDLVIVETVGVGQSETAVAGMTDLFLLLQLPNAGDELQAMKKGVVELADIVAVNKADIDARAAESAASQLRNVLSMLRPATSHWRVPVLTLSALRAEGIGRLWDTILDYRDRMQAHHEFDARRRRQAGAWMWQMIDEGLRARFRDHQAVGVQLAAVEEAVTAGRTSASAGAARLLALLDANGAGAR